MRPAASNRKPEFVFQAAWAIVAGRYDDFLISILQSDLVKHVGRGKILRMLARFPMSSHEVNVFPTDIVSGPVAPFQINLGMATLLRVVNRAVAGTNAREKKRLQKTTPSCVAYRRSNKHAQSDFVLAVGELMGQIASDPRKLQIQPSAIEWLKQALEPDGMTFEGSIKSLLDKHCADDPGVMREACRGQWRGERDRNRWILFQVLMVLDFLATPSVYQGLDEELQGRIGMLIYNVYYESDYFETRPLLKARLTKRIAKSEWPGFRVPSWGETPLKGKRFLTMNACHERFSCRPEISDPFFCHALGGWDSHHYLPNKHEIAFIEALLGDCARTCVVEVAKGIAQTAPVVIKLLYELDGHLLAPEASMRDPMSSTIFADHPPDVEADADLTNSADSECKVAVYRPLLTLSAGGNVPEAHRHAILLQFHNVMVKFWGEDLAQSSPDLQNILITRLAVILLNHHNLEGDDYSPVVLEMEDCIRNHPRYEILCRLVADRVQQWQNDADSSAQELHLLANMVLAIWPFDQLCAFTQRETLNDTLGDASALSRHKVFEARGLGGNAQLGADLEGNAQLGADHGALWDDGAILTEAAGDGCAVGTSTGASSLSEAAKPSHRVDAHSVPTDDAWPAIEQLMLTRHKEDLFWGDGPSVRRAVEGVRRPRIRVGTFSDHRMRSFAAAGLTVLATLGEAKVADYAALWESSGANVQKTSHNGKLFVRSSADEQHESMLRGATPETSNITINKVSLVRNPKTGFTLVSDHQGGILKVSAGTVESSQETTGINKNMFKDDEVEDSNHEVWMKARLAENEAAKAGMARAHSVQVGSSAADTTGAEVDSNGNIVIDYFCGFTKDAAAYVSNNLFMACEFGAQAVNSALVDSGITNARLRVVGAELLNESVDLDSKWAGLEGSDLKESSKLVGPLGSKHGADIMTTYMLRDKEKGDTTIGKGYVPGRYNLVTIDRIGSVEHEIGHNFGLHHCPGSKYPDGNTGFEVAELGYGTMMCGDEIPVWSSPNLKYQKYKLGDSTTNSVKFLQKSLATVSKGADAVYPLDETVSYKKSIHTDTVILKNKDKMSDSFTFTVTKDMKTVWITTNRGDIGYLYVQKSKAPTTSKYLAKSKYPVIQLDNPEPGTYHVAMLARYEGAYDVPRVVDIWVPAEDGEETETTTTTKQPGTTTTTKKPTSTTTTPGQQGDVPAWDKDATYASPCTKVSHKGLIFQNGWYTKGVEPDASQVYGVWRTPDSPIAHSSCK